MIILKILLTLSTFGFSSSELLSLDSYDEITKVIQQETQEYLPEELLIVFDLDDTVLRTLPCVEKKKNMRNFQFFEFLVKHCGAQVTSPDVPKIIKGLKHADYPVMALTARRSFLLNATLLQLSEGLFTSPGHATKVTFETAPGFNQEEETIKFQQPGRKGVKTKKVVTKNGVSFSSGANKGLALQALLKNKSKTYKRIIFIDDNKKNVRHILKAYKHATPSMLMIHYTEYDH